MNTRELFLQHVAQTSPSPVAIEVVKAKGSILIDADGKEYLDCIAGISVCNLGHGHPKVIKAIKKQLDDYMHVLVYGEMIESPQVAYAKLLTDQLPPYLNSVYFTNSGTEATEGSMKLAKRYTGRPEIICFNKCYHGSTQGALSLIGDEYWRSAFRPLLPGVFHLEYNDFVSIGFVTNQTACVILESVQAEAGVIAPSKEWMIALRDRCTVTGTLLILDEIQTGFGRTGTLWAFEQFGIAPDVLLLGKALGGGMPLGAFIASRSLMEVFTKNPVLGHITTFGGHPVSCAAGLASLKVLLKKNIIAEVDTKQQLFTELLVHPKILDVRANGLLMAVQFENASLAKKIIQACIEEGVLTDWFLFAPQCMRLAPPLTITEKEIRQACKTILAAIDSVQEV